MPWCDRKRNGVVRRWMALPAALVLLGSGCSRMKDSDANFARAIDQYYESHPSCLFDEAVRFPAQEDSSDPKQTVRWNALVDQNLLTRSTGAKMGEKTAGKKMMVVASRPLNRYDLSAQGHSQWIADEKQPGYGNLCYGHRQVVTIDSSSPTTSSEGAATTVVYRYNVKDVPAWAKAAGVQTAFPGLRADLSGREVGRASLTDTRDGWQVTSAPWAHIEDSDIYK